MISVELDAPADLAGFRKHARRLIADGCAPETVKFFTGDLQNDLFAGPNKCHKRSGSARPLTVPKAYVDLAERVICHSNPQRFSLLYRMLWRLQSSRDFLNNAADDDVFLARKLSKSVKREMHKMKAFVRFRKVQTEQAEIYVAWFEPEHHIIEAVAPFFSRRFTGMHWSILTPLRSVHWDGNRLLFSPGVTAAAAPDSDELEALWRTYYRSIFNPARLKVSAMRAEMPKKFWKNLPEAQLIPELVRNGQTAQHSAPAGTAVGRRQAAEWNSISAARFAERPNTLAEIQSGIRDCSRCELATCATQAVCGSGPSTARLFIVGEQPGDEEDQSGEPFIGPAGRLLDSALQEAGIDRAEVYLTNAVKHFKFVQKGERRIHKTPSLREVEHCRWWLNLELEQIKPRTVVTLGATAARSLTGRAWKLKEERGLQPRDGDDKPTLITTFHPAYVLRSSQSERALHFDMLVDDLKAARATLP